MEISKKSWHYQLNSVMSPGDWRIPDSLCPYFWYTIRSSFLALAVFFMTGACCAVIGWFLYWLFPSLSIYYSGSLGESFLAWLIFGAALYATVSAIVKDWHQNNYKWEYYPAGSDAYYYESRKRVPKKPIPWFLKKIKLSRIKVEAPEFMSFTTVTMKYIRAWHDKVCPSITFVNPNKR